MPPCPWRDCGAAGCLHNLTADPTESRDLSKEVDTDRRLPGCQQLARQPQLQQLAPPRDSIFDMQEVAGGAFDADFFDDGEVLSNVGDDESGDEALGPLREHKDTGKKKGGAKKKPAAKGKAKPKKAEAGAKRKAPSGGAGGGGGKKAKK